MKQSLLRTSCVKDEFDLTNLIQTKAEFSYGIAVMDRNGGWIDGRNEEGRQFLGVECSASMWIYTKAVICNGQRHHGGHQLGLCQNSGQP